MTQLHLHGTEVVDQRTNSGPVFRVKFEPTHAFSEINAEGTGFAKLVGDGFNLLAHGEPCVFRSGQWSHVVKRGDSRVIGFRMCWVYPTNP